MDQIRRMVYFSGRVQGVGFRATARWLARDYAVAGHVRNLPDGRVELIVEGTPLELDRFVERLCQEMEGYIANLDQQESPGSGLEGFHIAY